MHLKKNENGTMDKQSFCAVLERYQSICNFFDDIDDVFGKYACEISIFPSLSIHVVIDLLAYIFSDKDQWIAYWCYGLNFGNDCKDNLVKDQNGKNIPLKTSGDLYDLLVCNMNENGGE